ncbi:MAG: hypothetical protein JO197_07280 [Acidobacteria bacterium]|nr:hypothetical protein [Acidobacteriota bacterium]MBV9475804.1 hypothetical protein [Acidobacteriota bacterium]
MERRFRELFNAQFTSELYEFYKADLSRRTGTSFEFRLAESPLFLSDDFKQRAVESATAIVEQLSDPALIARMKAAIPERWNTPGMDALPNLAQVDFAVVRDADGRYVPKLIELQGFPSLTALQIVQRDAWVETLARMDGLDLAWSCWFSGYDRTSFIDLARRTIVGKNDPAEVILMDLDPPRQKTYPDFAATKLLFDVDAVDPVTLVKRGKQLFRSDGTPVRRIYNRVVFDELIAKGITLPFDYREELDVEWAPHPNWYWVWSKYSLPFLQHESVPRATFVSDLERIPDDLSRYVLKPLFSFAGGGVNVDPTRADVEAIPEDERHAWCLQEKIEYEPALQAADGGGVKIEIRLMFLRPDDEAKPILAQNLVRLSRGKMLGVDFNKQFTWVGSSVGLSLTS